MDTKKNKNSDHFRDVTKMIVNDRIDLYKCDPRFIKLAEECIAEITRRDKDLYKTMKSRRYLCGIEYLTNFQMKKCQ